MSRQETQTFVELKYFPVQDTPEYFKRLPAPVVETLVGYYSPPLDIRKNTLYSIYRIN